MQEVKTYQKLSYVLRFPDGYEEGKRYPVFLYIHGAGGRGSDIAKISDHVVFRLTEERKETRFIVAAPQCYADTWFEIFEQLLAFVDFLKNESFTDPARLYLAGASMGGYTAWQLAMTRPEDFAALIPICGGGMYWNAARLKNVPIWAHHGLLDTTVRPEESIRMVNAVNAHGGHARLSIYETVAHDSWNNAFSNPDVYTWMLSQHK